MQLTRTFVWGNATITVKRSTVRDRLATDVIASALYADSDTIVDTHSKNVFAMMVQRSDVVGDLGFAFPTRDASYVAMLEGYSAFIDGGMSDELFVKWTDEFTRVDSTVNAPALAGKIDPNDSAPQT